MLKPISEFEEISKKVIKGDARHTENRYNDFEQEILLPKMLSTEGPRLVIGDVNGDKLDDFILLGAAGDPDKLFLQQPDGTFNFKEKILHLSRIKGLRAHAEYYLIWMAMGILIL